LAFWLLRWRMVCETMPFGKYRGVPLDQVPGSYLDWVLRECDSIDGWLRDAIEDELDVRAGQQQTAEHGPAGHIEERLTKVKRELSLTHHPDGGGNVDVMKGINLTIDRLRELVSE